MGRVFSGIQPTGQLHLGNYLGALKNWIPMQEDHECLFCIVDLHALTLPQDPDILRDSVYRTAAAYLACGVDPEQSAIFVQSSVAAHSELMWLLACQTPLGWLNRMTQFKDKSGKHKEKAGLGLYAYPVLQAADILLYDTTHVPVGEDQKQHIELSRDIAIAFNHRYSTETFVVPEPILMEAGTRVMSLRDGTAKMSKSDPSEYARLNLDDTPDTISLKIRKARTDPNPLPETPELLAERPEAKNLVGIYAALQNQSTAQVCQAFSGAPFSAFKEKLTERVVETFTPISKRMSALLEDRSGLEKILAQGQTVATAKATETMRRVRNVMGL